MAALLKASRLLRSPAGALSSALQNHVFEGFSAVSPDKTCVECYAIKSDRVG
jgi:hypothetical protein